MLQPGTGTYPADCAATPNNNRGVVRYSSPASNATILAVWNLVPGGSTVPLATFGGGLLKSGNQTLVSPINLRAYQPSDRVELTNSFGVSIGSGDSGGAGAVPNDETYVEFLNLSNSPPTLVGQFVFSAPSSSPDYSYIHFGLANDLGISRDGDFAVVNSDNWIHVFDVSNVSQLIPATTFNIGSIDYGPTPPTPNWNRTCTPNRIVDSVAVTNERAVVTTARMSDVFGTLTTWVYIIDLTPVTGPAIVLQDDVSPPFTWEPEGDDHDRPHDVALTVARLDGRVAVVTTNHAVVAYDLTTNSRLSYEFDKDARRNYQKQVDSIELTDTRAVVIADHYGTGASKWRVTTYEVGTTSGLSSPHIFNSPSSAESHAHDLSIDLGFDKALIRATNESIVITGLSTTSPSATPLMASAPMVVSDAFAYEGYKQLNQFVAFSSDSTVICPPGDSFWYGATIGGFWNSSSNAYEGYVDIIDLGAASPTIVAQVPILTNSGNAPGCVPLDIAASIGLVKEFAVRSADTSVELSPATGPDLIRISLPSLTTTTYGGRGTVMGLDSLAEKPFGAYSALRWILSISEQELTSTGDGYAHVAQ